LCFAAGNALGIVFYCLGIVFCCRKCIGDCVLLRGVLWELRFVH